MKKLLFIGVFITLFVSCVQHEKKVATPPQTKAEVAAAIEAEQNYGITDYGNNVYYFEYRGHAFGESLSGFLGRYPGKHVTAIGSADFGSGCGDKGYFVTFGENKVM